MGPSPAVPWFFTMNNLYSISSSIITHFIKWNRMKCITLLCPLCPLNLSLLWFCAIKTANIIFLEWWLNISSCRTKQASMVDIHQAHNRVHFFISSWVNVVLKNFPQYYQPNFNHRAKFRSEKLQCRN